MSYENSESDGLYLILSAVWLWICPRLQLSHFQALLLEKNPSKIKHTHTLLPSMFFSTEIEPFIYAVRICHQ